MQLLVTLEEAQAIATTIGNLPTASGAYPLLMKIRAQIDVQQEQQRIKADRADGVDHA